jgi:SAM-dependent methyltransferase
MSEAWREANRANWDERVPVHLAAYDLAPLRAGQGRLTPIEEAELGPVGGLRVLHLQCHIGSDTLALAQRGAGVTGLDFSAPAIDAARALAADLGLPARFVVSDLYAAPETLPEPGSFDLVLVNWGAINWLPDIERWARVVAHFLRPGGALYLAEGHPAALVFDDDTPGPGGLPGFFLPYFHQGPLIQDDPRDYADQTARLRSARTYQYAHPLGRVVSALIDAGLVLEFLHEHEAAAWRMFATLAEGADGLYRWPGRPWLPLAFSLRARAPR